MRAPPPPWRRAATLVAVLALLTPGQLPGQAADPDLTTGLRQVSEGDYEGAVVTLDAVARRLAGDKSRRRDLIEAYVNLGVALVALDQRTSAKDRFRQAVALDPKLELSPTRYSPKVLAAFAEARREAAEEAAASKAKATPEPKAKGSSSKLPFILLGTAGAAAGVVVLATRGGDASGESARFNGAQFGSGVVVCPNGNVNQPIKVMITVDAIGGRNATGINSVKAVLTIRVSPNVPSEVGFASDQLASVVPNTVPPAASVSLLVETSILCSNGEGDAPRVQEWSGTLTLSTTNGPIVLETVDRLHVNIP